MHLLRRIPKKCFIYEVKCSMCDAIYIGNTQHTFKKIMDGHFSDHLYLLKNGKIYNSFSAHFEQHFKSTTSCTELHKFMTFKVVKQINPIGTMKQFTKPTLGRCRVLIYRVARLQQVFFMRAVSNVLKKKLVFGKISNLNVKIIW